MPKTFAAAGLLTLYVEVLALWIGLSQANPAYTAIIAGLLAGMGLRILIRLGTRVGGRTVTAIKRQKMRGWRVDRDCGA